jgi:flagellar FliL protein
MATPPTVLVDPSTSSSLPTVAAPLVGTKFPMIPLLVAVVAGVAITALSVGGVVYYLARTGRLPAQGGGAKEAELVVPAATHSIVLEPLLVNLANSGGSSYLRIAMTLRVADLADGKDSKSKEEKSKSEKGADDTDAAVRDTMLTVLGRQTADDLLAADGKEHLKAAMKSALVERNPDLKVADVFFTDFLVQR